MHENTGGAAAPKIAQAPAGPKTAAVWGAVTLRPWEEPPAITLAEVPAALAPLRKAVRAVPRSAEGMRVIGGRGRCRFPWNPGLRTRGRPTRRERRAWG